MISTMVNELSYLGSLGEVFKDQVLNYRASGMRGRWQGTCRGDEDETAKNQEQTEPRSAVLSRYLKWIQRKMRHKSSLDSRRAPAHAENLRDLRCKPYTQEEFKEDKTLEKPRLVKRKAESKRGLDIQDQFHGKVFIQDDLVSNHSSIRIKTNFIVVGKVWRLTVSLIGLGCLDSLDHLNRFKFRRNSGSWLQRPSPPDTGSNTQFLSKCFFLPGIFQLTDQLSGSPIPVIGNVQHYQT